jgi:hypothetical protein
MVVTSDVVNRIEQVSYLLIILSPQSVLDELDEVTNCTGPRIGGSCGKASLVRSLPHLGEVL